MGRLVIDGNSVYEIDEDCIKYNRVPKECQIYQFLKDEEGTEKTQDHSCQRGLQNNR